MEEKMNTEFKDNVEALTEENLEKVNGGNGISTGEAVASGIVIRERNSEAVMSSCGAQASKSKITENGDIRLPEIP